MHCCVILVRSRLRKRLAAVQRTLTPKSLVSLPSYRPTRPAVAWLISPSRAVQHPRQRLVRQHLRPQAQRQLRHLRQRQVRRRHLRLLLLEQLHRRPRLVQWAEVELCSEFSATLAS